MDCKRERFGNEANVIENDAEVQFGIEGPKVFVAFVATTST